MSENGLAFGGRATVVLPVLAALTLLLGGCSDSGGDAGEEPTNGASRSGAAASPESGPLPSPKNWSERAALASYRCMQERGWHETLGDDFSTEAIVPPDQREAYDADSEECASEYRKKFPPSEMTPAVAKELYALELKTVACLEKHGYPPSGEPISEGQYVDGYMTEGTPGWGAYDVIENPSEQLLKACPQPGEVLVDP